MYEYYIVSIYDGNIDKKIVKIISKENKKNKL